MELEFVRWLQEVTINAGRPSLIGNDGAVLPWSPDEDCVVTTDLLAEGVHFRIAECGGLRAGRKALAVNLSDLAAMAARPVAAFVSLLLPRPAAPELARELIQGMTPLCEQFRISIAGGDTNVWDGPLVLNVAAVGATRPGRAWTRSGMRPGDLLCLTGPLGDSRGDHHLEFTPRVREALTISEQIDVHAAIDITDGLVLDAWRLAEASGCGIEIWLDRIPLRTGTADQAANTTAKPTNPPPDGPNGPDGDLSVPLREALFGGEDFELLLAIPATEAPRIERGLVRSGQAAAAEALLWPVGRGVTDRGVWGLDALGHRRPLPIQGYEHGVRS